MIRQLLSLSAGEGVARGPHALAFLALARDVGPGALGAFGAAEAVASYGLLAVQPGLDVPAMLRVGRAPEQADAVRTAVVRLRLPVYLVLLAGAAVWGNWLLLAMAGMWLAAALQVRWLLLARGHSAAVVARLSLVWVAGALSVGELLRMAWCWRTAGFSLDWASTLAGPLQREAWPFLASVLLGSLLYNLDAFVLGMVRSGAEVGLYVAAYRLIPVYSPVLGALQNSSLPLFGKLYPDGAAAEKVAFGVWRRSAAVSDRIALVLAVTPALLLPLLYGAVFITDAAPLVRIFALVLPVQVTRMVYRQAREKRDLSNLVVAVGVNLGLDLVLAPRYGAMGCAISTLCAESCFAFMTWRAWRRMACA